MNYEYRITTVLLVQWQQFYCNRAFNNVLKTHQYRRNTPRASSVASCERRVTACQFLYWMQTTYIKDIYTAISTMVEHQQEPASPISARYIMNTWNRRHTRTLRLGAGITQQYLYVHTPHSTLYQTTSQQPNKTEVGWVDLILIPETYATVRLLTLGLARRSIRLIINHWGSSNERRTSTNKRQRSTTATETHVPTNSFCTRSTPEVQKFRLVCVCVCWLSCFWLLALLGNEYLCWDIQIITPCDKKILLQSVYGAFSREASSDCRFVEIGDWRLAAGKRANFRFRSFSRSRSNTQALHTTHHQKLLQLLFIVLVQVQRIAFHERDTSTISLLHFLIFGPAWYTENSISYGPSRRRSDRRLPSAARDA